jgi:hypothetical protein
MPTEVLEAGIEAYIMQNPDLCFYKSELCTDPKERCTAPACDGYKPCMDEDYLPLSTWYRQKTFKQK